MWNEQRQGQLQSRFPSGNDNKEGLRFGDGDAVDGLEAEVGEPDGAEAGAHAVAAGAGPLSYDLVGFGVDLGEREVEHGGEDVTVAEGEVAARTLDAAVDGGDELAGLHVDAGDGAVALVEGPDGAVADGDEAGLGADGDGVYEFVGFGVDLVEGVGAVAGDPDEASSEDGVFGSR